MPDISTMTDQEIIDYIRKSGSHRTAGVVRGKSLEEFYSEHGIKLRCPNCKSDSYTRNGSNNSGMIRYKCKSCHKSFLASTNTIFEGTDFSVDEMIQILKNVLRKDTIVDTAADVSSKRKCQYTPNEVSSRLEEIYKAEKKKQKPGRKPGSKNKPKAIPPTSTP